MDKTLLNEFDCSFENTEVDHVLMLLDFDNTGKLEGVRMAICTEIHHDGISVSKSVGMSIVCPLTNRNVDIIKRELNIMITNTLSSPNGPLR